MATCRNKTKITPVRLEAQYKEALKRIIKRHQCANESDAIRLAIRRLDEIRSEEEEQQRTG